MNWFDRACGLTGVMLIALTGCEIRVTQTTTPPTASNSAKNVPSANNSDSTLDAAPDDGKLDGKTATDRSTKNDVVSDKAAKTTESVVAKDGAVVNKPKELLPIESTSRRALRSADGVEVITFDDLNIGMQQDMVFREFLLNDRVKELEGQRVRLIGYMHGGQSQLKDIKEFVLLRNTECKFGPGGLADHLVRVLLKGDVGANYSTNAIQVEGVLKVAPFQGPDGNTWSVYDLAGEKVKEIRK